MPESKIEDISAHVSETVLAERSIMEEMKLENACDAGEGECTGVGECTDVEECTGVGECTSVGEGEEWHAARTHCTWPLAQRHRSLYEQTLDSSYVLEDDVPVCVCVVCTHQSYQYIILFRTTIDTSVQAMSQVRE